MMPETRPSCMFLLATLFTGILSSGTETLSKAVCLGDPVKLFEHVSLANRTIIINHIYDGAIRQIGTWFIKDSTIHFSIDKEFERIISLDKYGTVWIRKVQHVDEGTYTLLSKEDTGAAHIQKMELIVLEEPNNRCKPNIQLADTHLIAFLNVNACGRPAASAYWLGFNNQTSIKLQPEQEARLYHACIRGPSLRCIRGFKASDFCSSFIRGTVDKEMIPSISLVQSIPDGSILLKCQSDYKSSGRISWRLDGIPINSNAKYFQEDEYLTIRHLNNDDQYNIYTCSESGGRSESYPYSIETSGPSFVNANPSTVLVKEKDKLNVSCLTDCYPLCSVEWHRLDQSSGQKNVLSKDDVLQIANVTRMMSGNYSCKVQNPISGAFLESSFSLDVYYGPDEIFFNTSASFIEVDEFDSITILCSAECFPPCLITWTEMSAKVSIVDAELKLVNVSNNGTYTCLASNKKLDITKTSQTISIAVKLEGVYQTTSIYQNEYSESTHTGLSDVPSIRYLLQVIPGIGGIGIIAAVVCILRKKYISRSRVAQVSNLAKNIHSHTDDSHQEETFLQHYWTIVTNVRGEAFTALESDINVELTEYFDQAIDITPGHHNSEELEACSHYSDPIAIETGSSGSVKSDGYINPVHSSPAKSNEYINPRWSHPLECNAYIHPVQSGSFEIGGYADTTPSGYMGNNSSLDHSFPTHLGKHDEHTADAVERNEHIDYVPSKNVEFD